MNKCRAPSGVWAESYRHEIRLTAELMLLASRIGRALLTAHQDANEPSSDAGSQTKTKTNPSTDQKIPDNLNCTADAIPSPQLNSNAVDSLVPTFRTDIANK